MKRIFDSIKKFFKENYKGILILVFIYLLFNFKLDFSIYSPGGLINLDNRIESKSDINKSKGSINMTYVKLVKGTIPTYLLAKVIPTWDIVDNDDITYDGDIDETIKIDKYYLLESISNAYMVAYNEAGVDYSIKKSNNYITYIYEKAKTDLKLFDNIEKYDNIEFTTFSEMQEYITNKNVGDKITFDVVRNGKNIKCYAELIDLDGKTKVGLTSAVINEYDSDLNVSVKSKASESGSSGGFMTALAIYNAITKDDITKGRVIAGTGTIDSEGNVGEIGGVTYKLAGAYKNGADIMLVPKDNYEEALEYKKKHNLDIELVSINTFKEGVEYLKK